MYNIIPSQNETYNCRKFQCSYVFHVSFAASRNVEI